MQVLYPSVAEQELCEKVGISSDFPKLLDHGLLMWWDQDEWLQCSGAKPISCDSVTFCPRQAFRSWATLQDILGTFQHNIFFFGMNVLLAVPFWFRERIFSPCHANFSDSPVVLSGSSNWSGFSSSLATEKRSNSKAKGQRCRILRLAQQPLLTAPTHQTMDPW